MRTLTLTDEEYAIVREALYRISHARSDDIDFQVDAHQLWVRIVEEDTDSTITVKRFCTKEGGK